MTVVWRMDMSPSDKLVLLALADAANDDGVTWMAIKTKQDGKLDLLQKCSLSQRAIQTAIRRLEEAGLISRCEKPGKGVIYTVLPGQSGGVQQMHPMAERGAAGAGGGAAGAPKPSTNPQSKRPNGLFPEEPKPSRRKPRVLMPEGFPSETDIAWARGWISAEGKTVSIDREIDRIRNYSVQKAWRNCDWSAAWRNWIINACERAPSLGLVQTVKDDHDPWPMRMRAWSRQEGWNDVDWGPEPFEPGCRVPPEHLPRAAE
jgi:DNA-binding transcriptional ArsR family regulator